MKLDWIDYLVLLFIVVFLIFGCDTLPVKSPRELELERGGCHPCWNNALNMDGFCCVREINAEKLCL